MTKNDILCVSAPLREKYQTWQDVPPYVVAHIYEHSGTSIQSVFDIENIDKKGQSGLEK